MQLISSYPFPVPINSFGYRLISIKPVLTGKNQDRKRKSVTSSDNCFSTHYSVLKLCVFPYWICLVLASTHWVMPFFLL